MATISTRLMISGTGVTSDPIAVDYNKNSTVAAPAIETGGFDIAASGTVTLAVTDTTPTRTFVYLKNTGAVGQNFVTVDLTVACGEGATDVTIARLELGEFLYFPLGPSLTIKVLSSAAGTARIEYGYFSAA
jgi:hypothetical protein